MSGRRPRGSSDVYTRAYVCHGQWIVIFRILRIVNQRESAQSTVDLGHRYHHLVKIPDALALSDDEQKQAVSNWLA